MQKGIVQYAEAIKQKSVVTSLRPEEQQEEEGLPEPHDGEGCWDRAVTFTERHEGASGESQPSSSLCSHKGQPLWSQSKMNSEWCIRTANGIFLLGFHVDLLPSSSLILQLYSEHNLNIFHSCLILLLYYHMFLLQRRQWHPTPVLLPGKSHGRRSLEGCSPWGR